MDMSDQNLDLGALESEERIWRSNGGFWMRANVNGYPFKRSNTAKHSLKGDRTHAVKSGRKNKNGWLWIVYSIVVCFFIACFVAHALLQGTLMTFITPHGQSGVHDSEVEVDHLTQNHDQNMRLSTLEDAAYSGEIIKFSPSKFLGENPTVVRRNLAQLHPIRHARLALVCSDLSRSPGLLLLFSVATGLQALGYDLELYSLEDGPMRVVWEHVGTSVQVIQSDSEELKVDWLNFDGVFINSLEAKNLVSTLRHEPFNAVPVIWAIHENGLGMRLKEYASSQMTEILDDWNKTFHRADVIVFDDYTKPMIYSALDTGSFFVIPGSPIETWEAEHFMATHKRVDLREELGYDVADFVIVVVGSPFLYKGVWLEHTLILQAIKPLLSEFKVESGKDMKLKLIFMSGNSSNHGMALQAIALQLGFPNATVQHVGVDGYNNITLSTADLVIYSSLHEEQAFPAILLRAMSFEKLIVAPKLAIIQKYIEDGKHGLLFPLGSANMITKAMSLAVSNGRLSFLAHQIASAGRLHASNVMASDVIMGYANLLENVLQFSSDVLLPQPASEMPEAVKKGWQWEIFIMGLYESRTQSSHQNYRKRSVVVQVEERWRSQRNMAKFLPDTVYRKDATVDLPYWEEEKANEMREDVKMREGDELEERGNEPKRTWEDVNHSVKRVERIKDELHERDDGEMERTGQPLCIYEPYCGPGTWPFLHQGALYRGIGLATKSLRTGTDDVDALARLPLLNDSYYRNVLCEYGAYFAIANRVDDIHKNPWIGFQSWRAAGKQVSLSAVAEKQLIEAVTSGRHGNAVYFWVRMDTDVRHTTQGTAFKEQDFWSFCDAINAGNCRVVFTNAFKRMYNLPERWTGLPPMPFDGDFWSGLHSWAMPTSSFLELVMFARMFVDSLDKQYYENHQSNGTCCLSISKMEKRHCYCRLLELLVNVWAYHSAREMVYVDPQTGLMQEQHSLENRKGKMWVKWFSFDQLKAMDEDLAEEVDYDHPAKRWLWPSTGEIFWQGMYERESQQRYRLKMLKKRKNKEKRDRMQGKYRQKSLGKYKKPPPPEVGNSKRERQTA